MPRLSPVSWGTFIRKIKACGFAGPFHGGKHPFMIKGNLTITIPNPHREDISVDLLSRILKQAIISRDVWNSKK